MSELDRADLAYMAALVDNLAVLKTRLANGTDLPTIALTTARSPEAVRFLADSTASKVTEIARDYRRKGCNQHCTRAHVHIDTTGYRWQVTGTKATIVLHNLHPYMRVQAAAAARLMVIGKTIGYSGSVVTRMRGLGWQIPQLKHQPRSRATPITSIPQQATQRATKAV